VGAILYEFDEPNYSNAIRVINALLSEPNAEILNQKIRSIAHLHRNYQIAREVYAKVYSEELN
jgi:hypothetical protein